LLCGNGTNAKFMNISCKQTIGVLQFREGE